MRNFILGIIVASVLWILMLGTMTIPEYTIIHQIECTQPSRYI